MSIFTRRFPTDGDWVKNKAIQRLFSHWALPGERSDDKGLRVCIRNNYINFYIKGQSVAKLSVPRGEPKLEVHEKYVRGIKKGEKRIITGNRCISGDELAEVDEKTVDGWLETASTYASAEKTYVDILVAENPGTLDLEMALPADEETKSAPRMDLVVAQGNAIAFWEAKCSDNSEIRANAQYHENHDGQYIKGIKAIHQIRKYQRWMQSPGKEQIVSSAYIDTAKILLALAKEFKATGEALRVWEEIAQKDRLDVIVPAGLTIGEYDPINGEVTIGNNDKYANKAASFERHRKTLESHRITVVRHSRDTSKSLPKLKQGEASARPQR